MDDVLRSEIVEAQRARSKLIRWKLVLVAAWRYQGVAFRAERDGDA